VALKETLHGGAAGHGDALKREFGLLTRLCHPHLVAVHDWFDRSPLRDASVLEAPAAYTQEWVEGPDLFRALRNAPQPLAERIFGQVMGALAYLHALDVVHLDLKPENVLVAQHDTEEPSARVLDFGIATVVGDGASGSSARGSYSYIAPERLSGDPFDQRADLYALGVMMAETFHGRPPPPAALGPGGALSDAGARRNFLADGGVPPGWLGLVTSLTAADPSARPDNVSEAATLWARALGRPVELFTPVTVAAMLRTGPPAGRATELERCHQALDGGPVVLVGPPGIGRRTVARSSGRRAQVEGRLVEFWPTVPDVSTVVGFEEAVARLLPEAELAPLVAPLGEDGARDPDAFAAALRTRAAAWVEGLGEAARPPVRPLLVVEGLEQAPALVRVVVERLVATDDLPLGLVVTSDGYGGDNRCALAPLDRTAVEEFMQARLGSGALTERLAAALTAASGGHPEGLQSLLGLLAQRGDLVYESGAWCFSASAARVDLPVDLESAVEARVDLLEPIAQVVLKALAWLRFPSPASSVAATVGIDVGRAVRLLAEMEAAGLVWAEGNGRYRLGHGALAEVLHGWGPEGGAAAAHQRVLDCKGLEPLARAWHLGGAQGARASLDIGLAAIDHGRLERAGQAADLALELAPSAPEALELRARVANLLGPREVQVRCLEALIAVLPDSGKRRLEAEEALFWALTRIGDAPRAEAVGQRVIALAADVGDAPIMAEALVHLANVVIQRGDYGEGEELLRRAIGIAEGEGLMPVQARAYNNLGNISAYRDDHDGALRLYTRAHDLKVAEGDPVGQRIALGNMGLMALKLGRFAEAQRHFGSSLAAARATGHRRGEAWSLLALAVLGLEGGALAYASRRAAGALEIATELGDKLIACDAENTWAEVHLAMGDSAPALERARRSLELAEDVQSPYNAAGARVTMANALLQEAPDRAEQLAQEAESNGGDDVIRAGAARVRAEAAVARGDLDQAEAAARCALAIGGRGLTPRVLVTIGRVLRLVGDVSGAERVAAVARDKLAREADGWQAQPQDDGVDAAAQVDGPCRTTFLNIPDVVRLSSPDVGGGGRPVDPQARAAAAARLEQEAVTMSTTTDPRTAGADEFGRWARLAATASVTELEAMMGDWLSTVVAATSAERGFVVRDDTTVLLARDADGEAVSAPDKKLPEVAVTEALTTKKPWRAQGGQGGRGAILALPIAFGLSAAEAPTHWVLVLQNRFMADAFSGLVGGDAADAFVGPGSVLVRITAMMKALAEATQRATNAEERQRTEQTRSTEEILRLRRELETTREQVGPVNRYPEIVFASSRMKKMLRRVDRVVDSSLPVYVHGESGTGKELIARAIHTLGIRKGGPFVAQNCSAIPQNLFESEFFGHEKGAFTGADRASEGLFRRATGGTLFLDEIGDLPMDLQSKLLRVLETSEVRPVGGRRTFKVDVRIICATHRDLKEQVAQGHFREDLYYRLNVVRIDIPPLRERPEDIPLLVTHFLKLRAPDGDEPVKLSRGVMKALVAFNWPGNVRQLENEITRAALLCDDEVTIADLSEEVRSGPSGARGGAMNALDAKLVSKLRLDNGELKDRVDRLETWVLRDALDRHGGNKSRVARELGLSRAGLNMKLKRLALWESNEA